MRAFVFPGQGSQKIGMGADLADASATARAVFDEVDDALSQNLSTTMREGPEAELTLTENAQPAIMVNARPIDRWGTRSSSRTRRQPHHPLASSTNDPTTQMASSLP